MIVECAAIVRQRMDTERDPEHIAHDARGALSVIKLTTEGLEACEPDAEMRDDLETIQKHIDKLSALIDELARSKR